MVVWILFEINGTIHFVSHLYCSCSSLCLLDLGAVFLVWATLFWDFWFLSSAHRAQLDLLLLSHWISQLELAPVSTSRSALVDFSGRLCLCWIVVCLRFPCLVYSSARQTLCSLADFVFPVLGFWSVFAWTLHHGSWSCSFSPRWFLVCAHKQEHAGLIVVSCLHRTQLDFLVPQNPGVDFFSREWCAPSNIPVAVASLSPVQTALLLLVISFSPPAFFAFVSSAHISARVLISFARHPDSCVWRSISHLWSCHRPGALVELALLALIRAGWVIFD
jgi:hypothetical protein